MSVKSVESFAPREMRVTHMKSKQLPREILCNIFRYLDSTSLMNAASVNYRWKAICKKDVVLRKRIHRHLQLTSRKSRIQAIYDKDVTVNLNKHRISQIPLDIAKKLISSKKSDFKRTPLDISNVEIKSNPFKRSATRPKRMSTTLKSELGDVLMKPAAASLPVFHYDTAFTDCVNVMKREPNIFNNELSVEKDNLKSALLKKLFYPKAIKKKEEKSRNAKLSNSTKQRLFWPDPVSTKTKKNSVKTIEKPVLLYSNMDRPSIVTKVTNSNRSVGNLSSLALSITQPVLQKTKVRIHPIGPTFLLMLKRKPDNLQMPYAKRMKI